MQNGQFEYTGAITTWRGAETRRADIEQQMLAPCGLADELPNERTHLSALTRAMNEFGKAIALQRGKTWRHYLFDLQGGRELCLVETQGTHTATDKLAAAVVDKGGVITVLRGHNHLPLADLYQRFREAKLWCDATQVGTMLTKICHRLHSRSLRPGGGVHWIPPTAMQVWQCVADKLEACSTSGGPNVVHCLTTKSDTRTVKAILTETRQYIADSKQEIMDEITAAGNVGLGERAIKTRLARVEALKSEVREYETILQQPLGDCHVALGELDKALMEQQAVKDSKEVFAAIEL